MSAVQKPREAAVEAFNHLGEARETLDVLDMALAYQIDAGGPAEAAFNSLATVLRKARAEVDEARSRVNALCDTLDGLPKRPTIPIQGTPRTRSASVPKEGNLEEIGAVLSAIVRLTADAETPAEDVRAVYTLACVGLGEWRLLDAADGVVGVSA